jgi:hypothetical protein
MNLMMDDLMRSKHVDEETPIMDAKRVHHQPRNKTKKLHLPNWPWRLND